MTIALLLMTEYLALQQDSSGGMIRLPSRMIHIDKVCPIKKAGTAGTAGVAGTAGGLPRESSRSQFEAKYGEQAINVVQVSQSPKQSQAVSYSLSHPSLKEVSFKNQIFSNTFIQLTVFFVISSFWANFIIGNNTLHLLQYAHYSLLFTDLFWSPNVQYSETLLLKMTPVILRFLRAKSSSIHFYDLI